MFWPDANDDQMSAADSPVSTTSSMESTQGPLPISRKRHDDRSDSSSCPSETPTYFVPRKRRATEAMIAQQMSHCHLTPPSEESDWMNEPPRCKQPDLRTFDEIENSLSLSDEDNAVPMRGTRRFDISLPTHYQPPVQRTRRSATSKLDDSRDADVEDGADEDEGDVTLAPELKELIRRQHRAFGPTVRQPSQHAVMLWAPKNNMAADVSDAEKTAPFVELASGSSSACSSPERDSSATQPVRIPTPQPSMSPPSFPTSRSVSPIVTYPTEGRKRPMSCCATGVVEEVDDVVFGDVPTGNYFVTNGKDSPPPSIASYNTPYEKTMRTTPKIVEVTEEECDECDDMEQ